MEANRGSICGLLQQVDKCLLKPIYRMVPTTVSALCSARAP